MPAGAYVRSAAGLHAIPRAGRSVLTDAPAQPDLTVLRMALRRLQREGLGVAVY